jgi:2-keto-4-pentenoate hydratase/2-oxohepta-3-ene-1,7-dioic acid hydratase in catechol pathway
VVLPRWLDTRVDPEAEIVLLLGRDLYQCDAAQASAAIVAYTLGNDITARKQQGLDKERGWPWLRAKNLATFGCLGPAWVPVADVPDFAEITLRGRVNDVIRQEASLADMIWQPQRALVELSRWTPLRAGDIVFLGTPAGIAPIHEGDSLSVEADGLGRLVNPVVRG